MIKNFNLVLLTFFLVSPAYSAGKGLPQLDFTTYPSLIFWSILSLICLYLVMSFVITPKISSVINDRKQHLQNDLLKAKALKRESDENLVNVNAQLDKTKIEAKSIIEKAISDSKKESEKVLNDLNFKLNENILKSLNEINKEKSRVLEDIFKETFEISDLIIDKTSNMNSDKNKLTNIIKQEIKMIS